MLACIPDLAGFWIFAVLLTHLHKTVHISKVHGLMDIKQFNLPSDHILSLHEYTASEENP